MILETIPAIKSFTVDQKLRLVWELWNEVSHDPAISADTAAVLDERLAAYQADPSVTRTTDEVTEGIMQLKKRLAATRP